MRTMSGGFCLHYNCSNRNSFGYCKTPVCINEYYQQEQWGSPSTTNKSERVVIKPQTNADRIRNMSDEELARVLAIGCHETRECPTICDPIYPYDEVIESCEKCWLEWLKEEDER